VGYNAYESNQSILSVPLPLQKDVRKTAVTHMCTCGNLSIEISALKIKEKAT
jgi:hypothetical protein